MKPSSQLQILKNRIKELENENKQLRKKKDVFFTDKKTVNAPKKVEPIFNKAQETVREYFSSFKANPSLSKIEVNGQRYVLMRAESLANDFFKNILKLYSDRPNEEAMKIGRNLLFDLAHLIGIEDARNFHKQMKLKDPISKLSAGPVHFAYTGWAFVDILPESTPSPDENFFLKYKHPYSFEADSWIKAKEKTKHPVCSMNAGYSSGWCEESFGIELTSVEISCRARGDKECTFIMAPPSQIKKYLNKSEIKGQAKKKYEVPLFFERKKTEEKINSALKEKETLLKEIHHRVKNNLQIISSLLKLRAQQSDDSKFTDLVIESQNRIISMALIHEMLYANSDLSEINLSKYIQSLFEKLQESYSKQSIKLKLNLPENLMIEIERMIPIGLILNEVFSNSFKYAFKKENGTILIKVKKNVLSISDNGVGISKSIDIDSTDNFGMQLIHLLAEQIDSKVKIIQSKGTTIEFSFKENFS